MAAKFIVGIDLGGTNLKVALINLNYKIISKKILSTQAFNTKALLVEGITDSVKSLLKNNMLEKKDILGVGIGLPGPVDEKSGVVHALTNIPGWKEVNLKALLSKRLGLPLFLDNDAKLMSLAEYNIGAARGFKYAVCITLGTGVGGGIIIDGNLYRGKSNVSGEIGHIPINENGPDCNCGGKACLETYIGNNRITQKAKKIFKREISLEEISALAEKGNKLALEVWSYVGKQLGIALVGVVNLLNPDCIVVGGGVANADKSLFKKLREVISTQAMRVQAKDVKIFKAKLGNDAGLIGAAIIVKRGGRNT